MSNWFKKEPTLDEVAKETKKTVKSSQRDVDKELRSLDRSEASLLSDIKKRAKVASGPNDKILRSLATQLVQIRQQKERCQITKSQLGSMGMKVSPATSFRSPIFSTFVTFCSNAINTLGRRVCFAGSIPEIASGPLNRDFQNRFGHGRR